MRCCALPRAGMAVLSLAIASTLALGGCGHVGALMRADEIERAAKVDRVKFLDKVCDAYFLIGDEYYRLAVEAEDRSDMKRAKEYAAKASLYLLFSKGIKREAEEMRNALEGTGQGSSLLGGGGYPGE